MRKDMAHGWLKIAAYGAVIFFAAMLSTPMVFAKTDVRAGSLGVIVEKDLFRPTRQKPKPPRKAPPKKPEPVAVVAPPKSPPPRLTLSGTILLDSGSVALMSLQSAQAGSGRYRLGDEIEGFRITDITSESVILKRDDEVLQVNMGSGQGGHHGAPVFQQPITNAAASPARPADIPPELVPRPTQPFQRAYPYGRIPVSR